MSELVLAYGSLLLVLFAMAAVGGFVWWGAWKRETDRQQRMRELFEDYVSELPVPSGTDAERKNEAEVVAARRQAFQRGFLE